MKLRKQLSAGLILLGLSSALPAASFEDAATHLDTDGSLVGYINFEGDGQEIGSKLTAIYQDVLTANPGMMPIPVDFVALFDNLGFGCVEAIGVSSKEVADGLQQNKSVMLLNGEPTGLLAIYGNSSTPSASFAAAELAPADATAAISTNIDWTALQATVTAILTQTMGPMGEGLVQGQLQQMIPGTDIKYAEIITALSGRWDAFWLESYNEEFMPSYKAWIRIENAGALLPRLESILTDMGITLKKDETGTVADFSHMLDMEGMGLFIQSTTGGELIIYTHENWGPDSEGTRLNATEDYQKLAGKLPATALSYSYSAGYDINMLLEIMKAEPEVAPYLPIAEKAIELFVGDFLKPNITAMTLEKGVLYTEQHASFSTKQVVMVMPAALIGGVSAAMAIPAFEKVRGTSQEKAIINNLRQIASAADQYMLENGVTEVRYEQLIDPDNAYIPSLESVAGETYEGMIIKEDRESLSVELPDGRVITSPY
ncbi:hypothetical protein [Coraliomargarita akajimensis]|uniref:Uncharacterized protein n=1 Tax=Coraliomargarita akajimensis (strain DSM 45221 / IAM 15411 / JCM 23193 / KCTC 12865 / 04OKA010-24) TaxID=583355 RepID=D5EM83_CORAD|nr:hypothetical protein [Coraliomargarita akajimensis]ADE55243.1 hypothetical protein Caka_2226 [Coraliomargarita akajimensis DSM 45221]